MQRDDGKLIRDCVAYRLVETLDSNSEKFQALTSDKNSSLMKFIDTHSGLGFGRNTDSRKIIENAKNHLQHSTSQPADHSQNKSTPLNDQESKQEQQSTVIPSDAPKQIRGP
jgi:hypothetical protein